MQLTVPPAGAPVHTWPQVPQLFGSSLKLKQVLAGHSVHPGGHEALQAPAMHVATPLFGVGHTWPQEPQLLVVLRLVSQPLAGCLSQSAKPALQVKEQSAPVHAALALGAPQQSPAALQATPNLRQQAPPVELSQEACVSQQMALLPQETCVATQVSQ